MTIEKFKTLFYREKSENHRTDIILTGPKFDAMNVKIVLGNNNKWMADEPFNGDIMFTDKRRK